MNSLGLITFPQSADPRGNLTFIEGSNHLPFEIERVFWTYNVPSGKRRGGHSYKTQNELIVALSGAVDVITVDKFNSRRTFRLDRPNIGLFIPNGTWRQMELLAETHFVCI